MYPAGIRGPSSSSSSSSRTLHTSLSPSPFPRPTRRPSLPHLSWRPPPQAPSHTNRYSAVPPNRGRRMKIVIKNLSSPRTHCQEAKHRCFHPQCYLVFVPVCTDVTPTPKEKPQKCKTNNLGGGGAIGLLENIAFKNRSGKNFFSPWTNSLVTLTPVKFIQNKLLSGHTTGIQLLFPLVAQILELLRYFQPQDMIRDFL